MLAFFVVNYDLIYPGASLQDLHASWMQKTGYITVRIGITDSFDKGRGKYHISNPCIVTWVPFNEAWGQFKTPEIAGWIKLYDPSRLVNPASGGNFYAVGDMLDIHSYPAPDLALFDGRRACVLGEYGGIGLAMENHLWVKDKNWGYVQYKTSDEATTAFIELAEKLKTLIPRGFSAAVYTQTTDVEMEINGLMTYDRKVIKMDESRIRKVNSEICNSLK